MTRRVVAINGAGGALGAALAGHFAHEPETDVVLSDVDASSLDATVDQLDDTDGAVETLLADVSDVDEVEAVVARAVERFCARSSRVRSCSLRRSPVSPRGRTPPRTAPPRRP
jgi:NAD(P)-dependent dehydrogenase (short-subunit alcohol dehydrogenase family)